MTSEDAAHLYSVLQGADDHDPKTRGLPQFDVFGDLKRGVSGLRLAVMPTVEREGVDACVLERFDESLEMLQSLGAEIEVLESLPVTFADFADMTGRIIFAEGL